jgi:hypothetical protein
MDDVGSVERSFHFDASGIGSKWFREMKFMNLLIIFKSYSASNMVLAGGETGGQTLRSENFNLTCHYYVIWFFHDATFVNSIS